MSEDIRDIEHTPSCGNVFADLGLENADELLAKAELASRIARILEHRRLTEAAAGALLQTTQPRISDLVRGELHTFSMEQLLHFLSALDRDVHSSGAAPSRGAVRR